MNKTRIGIPRALLYYHYYPLWKTFYEELGAEVILSSKTTKGLMEQGIKACVDDACLPVKLYFGHVLDLKGKADYIFVPRLVSVEKRAYICPKFLGLPDMIQHTTEGLPPLINVTVDMSRRDNQLFQAARQAARPITVNQWKVWRALQMALKAHQNYLRLLERGLLPQEALQSLEDGVERPRETQKSTLNIALIGHAYNVYDPYLSMDLVKKLEDMGVSVIAPDNLPADLIKYHADMLPKKMFWSLGKQMLGSAFHFMNQPGIDGIIHVASFGCGPDSFTGEIVERFVRRKKKVPFLSLTLDEHTGEAGVVTRLEAFLDMIRWRAATYESNLSPHG